MTAETPRILLVDDDVDFVEMNRHVLEAGGYRVEAAYDAEEALGKMAALGPHLVITDLIMKTLDAGFSFARRVKEDPQFRAVRVIIVTSVTSAMGMDFRPRTPRRPCGDACRCLLRQAGRPADAPGKGAGTPRRTPDVGGPYPVSAGRRKWCGRPAPGAVKTTCRADAPD